MHNEIRKMNSTCEIPVCTHHIASYTMSLMRASKQGCIKHQSHTSVCVSVHPCARARACVRTCARTCICECMHLCISASAPACMCFCHASQFVSGCASIHASVHGHACIHTSIRTWLCVHPYVHPWMAMLLCVGIMHPCVCRQIPLRFWNNRNNSTKIFAI